MLLQHAQAEQGCHDSSRVWGHSILRQLHRAFIMQPQHIHCLSRSGDGLWPSCAAMPPQAPSCKLHVEGVLFLFKCYMLSLGGIDAFNAALSHPFTSADLKDMENEVRAIKKDGLLWGASMVPPCNGPGKLQEKCLLLLNCLSLLLW